MGLVLLSQCKTVTDFREQGNFYIFRCHYQRTNEETKPERNTSVDWRKLCIKQLRPKLNKFHVYNQKHKSSACHTSHPAPTKQKMAAVELQSSSSPLYTAPKIPLSLLSLPPLLMPSAPSPFLLPPKPLAISTFTATKHQLMSSRRTRKCNIISFDQNNSQHLMIFEP